MTLQEAKDEIAQKYGHDEWDWKFHENGAEFMEKAFNEVAELYARSKWDEALEADQDKMKASMPVGKCTAWDFVLWAISHFESDKPEFKP